MQINMDEDMIEFVSGAVDDKVVGAIADAKGELKRLAEKKVTPEEMDAWLGEIEDLVLQYRGYANRRCAVKEALGGKQAD